MKNPFAPTLPALAAFVGVDITDMGVLKRSGESVPMRPEKIQKAMRGAFIEVLGDEVGNSQSTREKIELLTAQVISNLWHRKQSGGVATAHIEEIQDVVEQELMRAGEHRVARAYVIYREKRAAARAEIAGVAARRELHVIDDDGVHKPLAAEALSVVVAEACQGLQDVNPVLIVDDAMRNLPDNATQCAAPCCWLHAR